MLFDLKSSQIKEEFQFEEVYFVKKGGSRKLSSEIIEENPFRRSKVSVMHADSVDYSFLGFLEEPGLEKPIQI